MIVFDGRQNFFEFSSDHHETQRCSLTYNTDVCRESSSIIGDCAGVLSLSTSPHSQQIVVHGGGCISQHLAHGIFWAAVEYLPIAGPCDCGGRRLGGGAVEDGGGGLGGEGSQ